MIREQAITLAQSLFLRDQGGYGCAETCLLVLSRAYSLDRAEDVSAAMALNGGIAWSGGVCGAITGAALAVGRLSAQRIADQETAKLVARRITMDLMAAFRRAFGDVNCRSLVGVDLSTASGHAAFVASGTAHIVCWRQVEFVVDRLVQLQERGAWDDTVQQLTESERPTDSPSISAEQGGPHAV